MKTIIHIAFRSNSKPKSTEKIFTFCNASYNVLYHKLNALSKNIEPIINQVISKNEKKTVDLKSRIRYTIKRKICEPI